MVEKVVIGNATLYLGDCLDVMPTLQEQSVDLLWSDPPYGHNNAEGDFLSRRGEIMADGRSNPAKPIANDGRNDMRRVVDGMLREAVRLLKADCCCCCCCCCGGGGPSPTFAWVAERMDRDGLAFFHSVIWDKLNPGVGWRYRRQHEMVMVAHRAGGKLAWPNEAKKQPNIIAISKPRDGWHPNEKPVDLVLRFIDLHTASGQMVLDPFMGSGTTGVAAASAGRRFVGIELDRKHFDTACRRIEQAQAQAKLFEPEAPKAEQLEIDA